MGKALKASVAIGTCPDSGSVKRLRQVTSAKRFLLCYRKVSTAVEGNKKAGGGLWGYIAGTPAT